MKKIFFSIVVGFCLLWVTPSAAYSSDGVKDCFLTPQDLWKVHPGTIAKYTRHMPISPGTKCWHVKPKLPEDFKPSTSVSVPRSSMNYVPLPKKNPKVEPWEKYFGDISPEDYFNRTVFPQYDRPFVKEFEVDRRK